MKQVFVSYAREDGAFAAELDRRLTAAGLDVWKDSTDLVAGDEWRVGIDGALDRCDVVVVVISPAAMESHFVTYEWARALGSGKPLIPVLVGATEIHPRLESIHHLDFTASRPWPRLLALIASVREQEPEIPVAVENTRSGLDDPSPATQLEALGRLAELHHPAALAYVVGALDHPSASVRRAAAIHLAERDEEEVVRALLETARDAGSPARDHALWALSDRPRPESVTEVLRGLRDDPDDLCRAVAVRAMGHGRLAADLPRLLAAVGDPSRHVRRYVWEALARYGGRAVPPLLDVAERPQPAEARHTLVKAFHRLGDPRAIPFLAAQLEDDTPTGDGEIQPSPHGFSRPAGARPLREHAEAALRAIGTSEALAWLAS